MTGCPKRSYLMLSSSPVSGLKEKSRTLTQQDSMLQMHDLASEQKNKERMQVGGSTNACDPQVSASAHLAELPAVLGDHIEPD